MAPREDLLDLEIINNLWKDCILWRAIILLKIRQHREWAMMMKYELSWCWHDLKIEYLKDLDEHQSKRTQEPLIFLKLLLLAFLLMDSSIALLNFFLLFIDVFFPLVYFTRDVLKSSNSGVWVSYTIQHVKIWSKKECSGNTAFNGEKTISSRDGKIVNFNYC